VLSVFDARRDDRGIELLSKRHCPIAVPAAGGGESVSATDEDGIKARG